MTSAHHDRPPQTAGPESNDTHTPAPQRAFETAFETDETRRADDQERRKAQPTKPSSRTSAVHPRRWELWTQPPRLVIFVLAVECCALITFGYGIAVAGIPPLLAWIQFTILVVGATIHIQLTHRQEERRRNRIISVHIDLTAVWIFPAALVLPVPLTLLLVAIIRTQRWFTARRPPHKFLFSSISIAFAAVLAHGALSVIDPNGWTELSGVKGLSAFAMLVVAGFVYLIAQAGLTGGFLALGGTSAPNLRNVLGSRADNLLELVTIGLGAVTAILLANIPPAVSIMALVTVMFNRLAEIEQLQADVRTDPKTGMLNMRGWSESAQRALTRTSRSTDRGLALLMVDLDHFKWINDTYGHPAGDDVLRSVAHVLSEVTRPADIVGRFGGEEFLILLPGMDLAAARQAAERIRVTIAQLRIVTTDKRGGQTTVADRTASIGVSLHPWHGDSIEALLQAADIAVYAAKDGGRDQVRFATEPAQGEGTMPAAGQDT